VCREASQKARLTRVSLVEADPVKEQAIANRAIAQLQADLLLRTVRHLLGDPGLLVVVVVVGLVFRQVQLTVEQAVGVVAGVGQVDRYDAIVLLADGTAPWMLGPRSFVALLDETGLVDGPDGVGTSVLGSHNLLELIASVILIPTVSAEELLQSPWRYVSLDCDRLNTFTEQVRQLSGNLDRQVSACVLVRDTVVEPLEVLRQSRFQLSKLLGIHASSFRTHWREDRSNDFALAPKQA
jgi:hypothetical protein